MKLLMLLISALSSNHIAKECSKKDTSEKIKVQQAQTETNEKKDNEKTDKTLERINVLNVIEF